MQEIISIQISIKENIILERIFEGQQDNGWG